MFAILVVATSVAALQMSQCGAMCKVNTDCGASAASVCGLCMPTKSGFRCASGCGMACKTQSDCGDANCGYCNATSATCGAVPPPPTPAPTTVGCGHQCVDNSQCVGECNLCFMNNVTKVGTCGVGCGMGCTQDSHCSVEHCGYCNMTSGTCSATPVTPVPTPAPTTVGCGMNCTNDEECSGGCNECVKPWGVWSTGKCGVGCDRRCTDDSQCATEYCGICREGFCREPVAPTPAPTTVGCGFHCTVNTDCSGECLMCFINNVTKVGACGTGCGLACTEDSHCLDLNCGSCNAGICGRKQNSTF